MLKFSEVFENLTDENTSSGIKSAELSLCDLSAESRNLDLTLEMNDYVPKKELDGLKSKLLNVYRLKGVNMKAHFAPDAFCGEACSDICETIKAKNAAVNGYLNSALFSVSEDEVTVTLKFGGLNTLKSCGFCEKFSVLAYEMFSKNIKVLFDGQEEDVEIKLPPVSVPVQSFNGNTKKKYTGSY